MRDLSEIFGAEPNGNRLGAALWHLADDDDREQRDTRRDNRRAFSGFHVLATEPFHRDYPAGCDGAE